MEWKLWLAGSNLYTESDDNSEVVLSALPAALQTVSAPNWLPVKITALDPEKEPWSDGAVSQRQKYNLQAYPLTFPDEMSQVEAIEAVFRNKYVYICLDGNGQSAATKYPYSIHTSGNCIALARNYEMSPNHDHDTGKKILDISISKVRPVL